MKLRNSAAPCLRMKAEHNSYPSRKSVAILPYDIPEAEREREKEDRRGRRRREEEEE